MDADMMQRQVGDLLAFKKQAQPIIEQTLQFLRGLPLYNERLCEIESAMASLQAKGSRQGQQT